MNCSLQMQPQPDYSHLAYLEKYIIGLIKRSSISLFDSCERRQKFFKSSYKPRQFFNYILRFIRAFFKLKVKKMFYHKPLINERLLIFSERVVLYVCYTKPYPINWSNIIYKLSIRVVTTPGSAPAFYFSLLRSMQALARFFYSRGIRGPPQWWKT